METITLFYSKRQAEVVGTFRMNIGGRNITYTEMKITRNYVFRSISPLPHTSNWPDAAVVYQFSGTLEQCMAFTIL